MNKNILAVAIIVIIAAAGAAYFLMQPKSAENPLPETSQPPSGSAGSKTYSVSIESFSFKPAEISIKKGDTVVWTNQDSAPHNISWPGFKSETFTKGQSYSFTFNDAGIFDYICGIHPSMKGKITVE